MHNINGTWHIKSLHQLTRNVPKIVLHRKLWRNENPTIIAKHWRNHGNKVKWITFTRGLTKVVGFLDDDVMSGDDRWWIWWYFQWALILKQEIKKQSLPGQVSSRDTALVHLRKEFKEFKAWQSMLTGIIWPPAHWQAMVGKVTSVVNGKFVKLLCQN